MDFKKYNKLKGGRNVKSSKDFLLCCMKLKSNQDFSYIINTNKSNIILSVKSGEEEYKYNSHFYGGISCTLEYGAVRTDYIYFSLIIEQLGIDESIVPNLSMYLRFINQELNTDDIFSLVNDLYNARSIFNLISCTQEDILFSFNHDSECITLEIGDKNIDTALVFDDLPYNLSHLCTNVLKKEIDTYNRKKDESFDYIYNYSEGIKSVLKILRERNNIGQDTFMKLVGKYISNNTKSGRRTQQQKTYIMLDTNTNLYKIGKSVQPKVREKTLQSEKPSIELLYVANDNIESTLHNIYKQHRVRGEWFNLTKDYITKIVRDYKFYPHITNDNTTVMA